MTELRVAVIGGSIGGLTAGLVLRDVGCDVNIFERSTAELQARGAGIVALDDTVRYLMENEVLDVDAVTTPVSRVQYLNPDDSTRYEEHRRVRLSSWNTIYRALLSCFDRGRYHMGAELVGFDQDGAAVTARFANGESCVCDLLVCADGVGSTARELLLPDVVPSYAGYVAWRGTFPEGELTTATYERLHDAFTYQLFEHGHTVVYPIPNVDGDLRRRHRRTNFMVYQNVTEGDQLDDVLADTEGNRHETSVPPGVVQTRHVAAFRHHAREHLAPSIREVVLGCASPYVQVIFDIDVPAMAFGRVCLLGDAAFVVRPHVGAGTAKAASDAWVLARVLDESSGDVRDALSDWERSQMELGRKVLERGRTMGTRAQFEGSWVPGDPSLRFGLYGPGR